MINSLNFAFFGTGDVSVSVLEDLKKAGYIPKLIVTPQDKPQGRKFVVTPPKAKIWAIDSNVPVLQPEKLDDDFYNELKKCDWDLFIVVAYGKIIPERILDIPVHKSINIHYSLLPKLRGSSPVEGAILQDEGNTGVSIILMDNKMDHGPLIAQREITVPVWPLLRSELMNTMNTTANKLLVEIIPKWVAGEITPTTQDESKATYVQMIKKEDALIDLSDDGYLNYRKICAYEVWPRAYFIQNEKRVIITSAKWVDEKLTIQKVIPEGKKEMDYMVYLKSIRI